MTTIDYTAPFSEARSVRTFHTAITAIGSFLAGLSEGFVAYRQFEERRSWRVGHDIALRHAMEQRNSPAPARLPYERL